MPNKIILICKILNIIKNKQALMTLNLIDIL